MAVFPASMMLVPNDLNPQPMDRKAGLAAVVQVETPVQALGEAPPPQYTPTLAAEGGTRGPETETVVYFGGIEAKKAAGD
jgi:hypothetical protein